jgi:hypothetical protein
MAMPGGWRQFYNEVADFSETVFGISRDDEFETVLRFNESVMPDEGITYPLKLQLDHDVERYFQENLLKQTEEIRALSSYSPAIVMIEDKYSFASIDYASVQYDTHQTFWELQSNVTRSQSVPNFL